VTLTDTAIAARAEADRAELRVHAYRMLGSKARDRQRAEKRRLAAVLVADHD